MELKSPNGFCYLNQNFVISDLSVFQNYIIGHYFRDKNPKITSDLKIFERQILNSKHFHPATQFHRYLSIDKTLYFPVLTSNHEFVLCHWDWLSRVALRCSSRVSTRCWLWFLTLCTLGWIIQIFGSFRFKNQIRNHSKIVTCTNNLFKNLTSGFQVFHSGLQLKNNQKYTP